MFITLRNIGQSDMNDFIEITIDGTYSGTYYVQANLVKYLTDKCINTGSTTIYLYSNIDGQDRSPYIVCETYRLPYYRSTGYQTTYINNISNTSYNAVGYFYRNYDLISLFVYFTLALASILSIFKR